MFEGICSDLFPGVKPPQPDYQIITEHLTRACKTKGLQPSDRFLRKILEIYEMMLVRHGFMIVGLPFAGKTSAWKTLQIAMNTLNEAGQLHAEKVYCPYLLQGSFVDYLYFSYVFCHFENSQYF